MFEQSHVVLLETKMLKSMWTWWCEPIVRILGWLRQQDDWFEGNLGFCKEFQPSRARVT